MRDADGKRKIRMKTGFVQIFCISSARIMQMNRQKSARKLRFMQFYPYLPAWNGVSESASFFIALLPECYTFAHVNKTLGQAIVL